MEEEKGRILEGLWNIQAEEMRQISFSFSRFCFKMAGKDQKKKRSWSFSIFLRISVSSQRFSELPEAISRGSCTLWQGKKSGVSSAGVSAARLFVRTRTPVPELTGKVYTLLFLPFIVLSLLLWYISPLLFSPSLFHNSSLPLYN